MHRLALLVLSSVLVLVAPAEAAKVRCSSGTTVFVEGGLRIFGTYFSSPDEWGYEQYACLGGARRPLQVGLEYSNTGTGSDATPAYAVARRGRMLADYSWTDGEGGPSASLRAVDVRARRTVNFMNVVFDDGVPAFRVTSDGTLLLLDPEGDVVLKPRGRRASVISDGAATDLATFAGTVYWSEGGQPRMTSLGDVDTGRMLEPVRFHRHGGPCARRRGRTVAASGSVRVFVREDVARACRLGRRGGPVTGVLSDLVPPHIVADRWILTYGEGAAYVHDSRSGRRVTAHTDVASAALLRDGTLAWIDFAGRLLAQSPGAAPVELSPAGATALAASRRAIYWTEAGTPRRYRP